MPKQATRVKAKAKAQMPPTEKKTGHDNSRAVAGSVYTTAAHDARRHTERGFTTFATHKTAGRLFRLLGGNAETLRFEERGSHGMRVRTQRGEVACVMSDNARQNNEGQGVWRVGAERHTSSLQYCCY